MEDPIFAHSVEGQPVTEWETLEEHSLRVAKTAETMAASFGAGPAAAAVALLHDLGKAKPGFQRKLAGERNDVTHSAEGALRLAELGPLGLALRPAIAGHHGALPNPERLDRRLAAAADIPLPGWCAPSRPTVPTGFPHNRDTFSFSLQFFVRMIYSCLTDADDRETGAFYHEVDGKGLPSVPDRLSDDMRAAFNRHMRAVAGQATPSAINVLRAEVLEHALQSAQATPGLFTLTVPTGGGKTLASLGFGLEHAAQHGLRRIVYVVPYTSIVEQTASVFREVLGSDAVLEHHASFDDSAMNEDEREQRRSGTISWNRPVIVTTGVQFFESMFAARKRRCRKLHNLAQSVIILDEAQSLPLPFLRPCLAAIRELSGAYGASVVLCTATQPALTKSDGFPASEALQDVREIAPEPDRLYDVLKRVEVRNVGALSDSEVAERLLCVEQVLVIVDNRAQARRLFDAIREQPSARHLSTLMTAAHRRAVLQDVRALLAAGQPVRLVSTSLIEAGVDISFPRVLRAEAGIDSIAQAAGRCNRNGELGELGLVEVFAPEVDPPPAVKQFAETARRVMATTDDPLSRAAVTAYFRDLWDQYGPDALDAAEVAGLNGILHALAKCKGRVPYEDIEAAFRLIPDGQKSVVIRDGEYGIGSDELDKLRFRKPGTVARAFQPHTVSVPYSLWDALWQAGHLKWWEEGEFGPQFAMLEHLQDYDAQAGLGIVSGGMVI
ncbi:CRISPR-associated endonuclease Cas3'' [Pontivivens insulae]|uniref:CRISPR-associated endonuclease/helicase Cas3 n=1 Tax=Pontivivens insulae TaxID=1639689 RepID=A0A2R8AGI5_9RHOB|nr:CRISPR-associated endonuclease Cas3'' [Pontivivens insulae]RED10601.1 CRISPR-associated Cas3 family helicase [Pontivivens insulae]SPF31188.1 hypothetical protein POI8812_03539 [Pontivivens insulae]